MKIIDVIKGLTKNDTDIRAGEDKALNSLRRQAQRYVDQDEKDYLKRYIQQRQFDEGRRVFSDKGMLSEKSGPLKKKVVVQQSFFGKGGFI